MSDAIFYVYEHRTNSGDLFYIGKGKGKRYSSPLYRNRYWGFVAEKHGFNPKIIQSGMTESDAYEFEEALIDFARHSRLPLLTNFAAGGRGGLAGSKLSEDTKRKISDGLRGRIVSPETRAKISAKSSLLRHTDEVRRSLSDMNKGKKLSIETRMKISSSNTGKTRSDAIKLKFSDAQKKKHLDGYVASQETRDKMRSSRLANVGKPISDETRKKLSDASKKRVHTPEISLKMSIAQKKSKSFISDETRLKMSIAAKNRIGVKKNVAN